MVSPGYPFNIRLKGQRSRSVSQVQKYISVEGDRVVSISLHSIEFLFMLMYHFLRAPQVRLGPINLCDGTGDC